MKQKNNKRALFISGLYIVLIAILLVTMTLSKYTDTKLAYTSFGADSFNVVVLNGKGLDETPAGETESLSTPLSTAHFEPGMNWSATASENTSAEVDFCVANGTTAENVSQVGIQYSIRLRTGDNLPLKYTLAVQTGADAGDPVYTYYTAGAAVPIAGDDSNAKQYEYTFYNSAQADADPQEASFKLDGNALLQNPHKLIIEWPADTATGTNSPKYMKEVEMLELVVTASSLNRLADDDYVTTPDPAANDYGAGIVLLTPPTESDTKSFVYTIDYRSFQFADGSGSYTYSVDNGINYAIKQAAAAIDYSEKLKVAVGLNYSYALTYADTNGTVTTQPLAVSEYRLYNEKDGTYTSYKTMDGVTVPDEKLYRWYAIYDLPKGTLFNTSTDAATGEPIPYGDSNSYTLTITKTGSDAITDAAYVQQICFANKLELLIDATYAAASTPETP